MKKEGPEVDVQRFTGTKTGEKEQGRTAEEVPEELKSAELKQGVAAKAVACTALAVRVF